MRKMFPFDDVIMNCDSCTWKFSRARITIHDNVIKWKHFPRNWPFVRGIHRSPLNSPHKGQWRGALMFSLICAWINAWVNNREAGDLRRNRAHNDVSVMYQLLKFIVQSKHKLFFYPTKIPQNREEWYQIWFILQPVEERCNAAKHLFLWVPISDSMDSNVLHFNW